MSLALNPLASEPNYGGMLSPQSCGKCGCLFVKMVTTRAMPVNSVGLACFMCGLIVDYADGLLQLRDKLLWDFETPEEERLAKRSWVIRYRLATQPRDDRTYEAFVGVILMGLEGGLTIEQVAEELNVTAEYVHAVAVRAGLEKAR